MLIEKRAMPTLDNAVRLRPVNPGSLVLDVFELQKQLVRMTVFATAEFTAVVGEQSIDFGSVRFKGRQHIIVDQLDSGERQLVRVEPGPGMPAAAVNDGLQIDLADALQDADKEGVDGDQSAGVRLDMTLAVFRAEPLQELDLFLGQLSLRSAVAFSSRNSRSCLVNRLWRCQTRRTPPAET
jgi:hypothetical protein